MPSECHKFSSNHFYTESDTIDFRLKNFGIETYWYSSKANQIGIPARESL